MSPPTRRPFGRLSGSGRPPGRPAGQAGPAHRPDPVDARIPAADTPLFDRDGQRKYEASDEEIAQQARRRMIDTYAKMQTMRAMGGDTGILDVTDPLEQLAVLGAMPANVDLDDISDEIDLPQAYKATPTRTLLALGEGILKSGRTYRLRPRAKPHQYYSQVIAQQLDSAALSLTTSTPQAQFKTGAFLYLVFWTSTARSAKQTTAGSERTITLSAQYSPPNRQLAASATPQAGFTTTFLLYQVSASVNASQQLAGDIVVQLPDTILPQYFEMVLAVSVPGGAPTTICDAVLMSLVT